MRRSRTLQVLYDGRLVGNLAVTSGRKAAFQYSEEWLETGFAISPFSLPLKEQVFLPTKEYYGEHTTTVDGNGRNPGKKEIVAVGIQAGLEKVWCEDTAEEIEKTVKLCLHEYL